MRLSDFILGNLETILQEWENFARSVETPTSGLDTLGLRDHAQQILNAVALDIRTTQSEKEQIDKSHGLGPANKSETAAQTHALLRLQEGFTLDQMVSEYRALRSSVLRLWLAQGSSKSEHQTEDMIRFNEAIDQAMVESIAAYGRAVETTRKIVLGVLGHDLRNPLGAILMSGDILRHSKTLDERQSHLAKQISASVRRANQIVNDLLDLASKNLGSGIQLNKHNADLRSICQENVEELTAVYPHMQIIFNSDNVVTGRFDAARIGQALSNLMGNAAKHGDKQRPVLVTLNSNATSALITVQNYGKPIPSNAIPTLFNPVGRYSKHTESEQVSPNGLGLGLFVAAEIVAKHGGNIEVESTQELGTIFRVTLPLC